MRVERRQVLIASAFFNVGDPALNAGGVIHQANMGTTKQETTSQPSNPSAPRLVGTGDLITRITMGSEAETSNKPTAKIDSPGNDHSLREEPARSLFKPDFTVVKGSIVSLHTTHVELQVDPAASYIECSIGVGDQTVPRHRSEENPATATREHNVQFGPSR